MSHPLTLITLARDDAVKSSSTKANPSRGGDAKLWALTPSEGGRFKAARLPKGWTGPVSMLGYRRFRKEAPDIFLRTSPPGPGEPQRGAVLPFHAIGIVNFIAIEKHIKIAPSKDGSPLHGRVSKLSYCFGNGLPHRLGAGGLHSLPWSEFAWKLSEVILVLAWVGFFPQPVNRLKCFQKGNAGLTGNRGIADGICALLDVVREHRPLSQ